MKYSSPCHKWNKICVYKAVRQTNQQSHYCCVHLTVNVCTGRSLVHKLLHALIRWGEYSKYKYLDTLSISDPCVFTSKIVQKNILLMLLNIWVLMQQPVTVNGYCSPGQTAASAKTCNWTLWMMPLNRHHKSKTDRLG